MKALFFSILLIFFVQTCTAIRKCPTGEARTVVVQPGSGNNIGWWTNNKKVNEQRSLSSANCSKEGNERPTLGLYFSSEAFSPNASIDIAGFLFNRLPDTDMTLNKSETCDLTNHPFHSCTSQSSFEKRACFSNDDDVLNYSSIHFGTENIKVWRQDQSNFTANSTSIYSVTVISSTLIVGCNGNPLACHQVEGRNKCKVYVCHAIDNMEAYLVVVSSEQLGTRTMIGICHYQTDDFDQNHEVFKVLNKKPGDPVCHFVFQGGFILCPEA